LTSHSNGTFKKFLEKSLLPLEIEKCLVMLASLAEKFVHTPHFVAKRLATVKQWLATAKQRAAGVA
jgi:hypothetical protein